ncbi:MAG: hypothetical protein IKS52_02695, partial [Clostridia bacterium]|nr:hypothetical protein [Clostridia bacterium]
NHQTKMTEQNAIANYLKYTGKKSFNFTTALIDMSAEAPAEGLWTDSGALVVSSPAQFRGIGIVAIDPTGRCAAMVMDDSWF